jgi:hypothetical protein
MNNDPRIKIVFPETMLYLPMPRVPVKGDYFEYELTGKVFRVTKVVFSTFSSMVTAYVEPVDE